MEAHPPTATRRLDDLIMLQKFIPLMKTSIQELEHAAMSVNRPEWKDILVRLWQQDEQCLVEVESMLRAKGGHLKIDLSVPDSSIPQEPYTDLFLRNKALLLRCINQKNQMLQAFAEARRQALSFEIGMMVQRHQLQALDALERLTALYVPLSASEIRAGSSHEGKRQFINS